MKIQKHIEVETGLRVWNTTGAGKVVLSLRHVLKRYRLMGHKPRKNQCLCCWHCRRCGAELIDDRRTMARFDRPCVPIFGWLGKRIQEVKP